MFRYSFLLSGFLLLSACSTVLDGPTQDMRVETPGAKDSICYLENDYARYKVMPPQTVKITKFKKPFDVSCLASGNRKKVVHIEPKRSDKTYWNMANAGVGALADHDTGSMYMSPELVVVDFTDMKPTAYPKPGYQHDIMQNPMIVQYEEFRPGMPALQSDRYDQPYELEKTDRAISLIGGVGTVSSPESSESSSSGDTSGSSGTSDSAGASAPSGGDGSSADSLTRSMNPDVFYGGSSAGASSAPTDLR